MWMAAIEEPKCSYYSQHFNDNDKSFELMPGKINIQTSFHHFTEKDMFFFETKINARLTD